MLDRDNTLAVRDKTIAALFRACDYKEIIRFCRSELRHDQRYWVRRDLLGYEYMATAQFQDYARMERLLWQMIQLDILYQRLHDVFNYIELGQLLLLRQKKRPALYVLNLGLDLAMKEKELELNVFLMIYELGLEKLDPKWQSRYKKVFYQVLENWDITLPDDMKTVNLESITYARKADGHIYSAFLRLNSEVILLRKENKTKEADALISEFIQEHPTPHLKRKVARIPNSLD
jgi:hypothetical protein